jgi:hypothetical protein
MPGPASSTMDLTPTSRAPEPQVQARREKHAIWFDVLFLALLTVDIGRTLHHAMWRDEMQIFLLGAYSPTLGDLFANLAYEPHPDLWNLIVWITAQAFNHPIGMQLVHIVLAVGVWLLIWRASPFSVTDKFLLLLSYFVFWEYFVISRPYVLIALGGFSAAAVRSRWPRAAFAQFLTLCVLANSMVLGTIWSMVMAARLLIQRNAPLAQRLAGGAVYLVALAAAVASMIPAQDVAPHDPHIRFVAINLPAYARIPATALLPIDPVWFADTIRFLIHPVTAPFPQFWDPNPLETIGGFLGDAATLPLAIGSYLLPVLACWFIVRDRRLVTEFTLTYLGLLTFAALWDYQGEARHRGVVFLALVGTIWIAQACSPLSRWRAWAWHCLLIISATGGILTLASELRPFSQGRNVAEWLERNGLADAFIMGSRDTTMVSISGYLRRPIYMLECGCFRRFIVWNGQRTLNIDSAEIVRRAERALTVDRGPEAVLIANRTITLDDLRNAPGLTFTLLQSFTGAVVETENFFVFRVTRTQASSDWKAESSRLSAAARRPPRTRRIPNLVELSRLPALGHRLPLG